MTEQNDIECANEPGPIVQRIENAILATGTSKRSVRNTIMEITGITKGALVKWFSGDTAAPRVEHLVALSDHLDIDLIWLIKGTLKSSRSPEEAQTAEDIYKIPAGSVVGRIKKILLAANVPAHDLYQKLGEICAIPSTCAETWDNSQHTPEAENLAAISKYYGIDLQWLITGQLKPRSPKSMDESESSQRAEGWIQMGNVQLRPWEVRNYQS